ncbi:MAG TPA: zf-HC2 domain-containing protein [Thermoanaerobaculia bacterium]|nr:zf-HC2 domain-containing protein [Thermoanaerobaculia bacterium]
MQEFRPTTPTPTPPPASGEPHSPWESCPYDEDLAAYVDGALSSAEMKRVEEHIASCEDCYNIYLGVLQFQLEHEPVLADPGEVVRFPPIKKPPKPWWLGKAAAALAFAVVGLGGGGYAFLLTPPPGLSTDKVTQPIQGREGLAESSWLGPTFRGSGDGEETPLDPASFQLGVQLVNLQVSLGANEAERSQDVVARILNLLESQLFVDDLKEAYKEITVAISDGTPPTDLVSKASDLAGRTREALDTTHLDLGQWVEAGRLASIAQEPSFFQRGENRSFLRKTIWRQRFGIGDLNLDPAALESLKDISEVLDQGDLSSAEYAKLKRSFDQILQLYYPA